MNGPFVGFYNSLKQYCLYTYFDDVCRQFQEKLCTNLASEKTPAFMVAEFDKVCRQFYQ